LPIQQFSSSLDNIFISISSLIDGKFNETICFAKRYDKKMHI
jgi:hypothetical protein